MSFKLIDMATPQINTQPFTERADLVRVLASLPEKALLSAIAEKSLAHEMEWLEAAMDAGLFDAAPFIARVHRGNDRQVALVQDEWIARCEALLNAMAGGRLGSAPSGPAMSLRSHARFDMPVQVKDFFEKACDHLAGQYAEWEKSETPDPRDGPNRVIVQCMGMACLMDRPALLQRLVTSFPQLTAREFRGSGLGNLFSSQLEPGKERMLITPLFCALEFSRASCVSMLLSPGQDYLYTTESPFKRYGVFSSMDHLEHHCAPEVVVQVLSHAIGGGAGIPALDYAYRVASDAMNGGALKSSGKNAALVPAFLMAGVYDHNPADAIGQALVYGHTCVIEHFKGQMPWNTLKEYFRPLDEDLAISPLFGAILNAHETALMALVDQAKADGRMDAVLHCFSHENDHMPLQASALLIQESLGHKILPRLLDAGLDPLVRVRRTTCTFKELADQNNTPAGDILRSFAARNAALSTLAELARVEAGAVASENRSSSI